MACHIVLSESGKDVLCMAKSIITIGRQYGSGGREIGEKVAERLLGSNVMTVSFLTAQRKTAVCVRRFLKITMSARRTVSCILW